MMSKIIWLYGRSGAGKTTLGKMLRDYLEEQGHIVCFLDGDNMRKIVNRGLGFSRDDRHRAAKRVCYVAEDLNECNYVIVCMVTPLLKTREWLLSRGKIDLVYIEVPLEECMRRDNKNLYKNKTKDIDLFEDENDWEIKVENYGYSVEENFTDMVSVLKSIGEIK